MNSSQKQDRLKSQYFDSEIHSKIENLAKKLELSFPGCNTEIDSFPSGSIMLDISRDKRLFVLAYSPKDGFCVDEVYKHDAFNSGYSFCSENLDIAFERLIEIIQSSI
jgi:hypothetical protein